MKYTSENISNHTPVFSLKNGTTDISYAVVAVLGIAKKGPIVK